MAADETQPPGDGLRPPKKKKRRGKSQSHARRKELRAEIERRYPGQLRKDPTYQHSDPHAESGRGAGWYAQDSTGEWYFLGRNYDEALRVAKGALKLKARVA